MSAWKFLVRNLYALDRPAPIRHFDDPTQTIGGARSALQVARLLGLIYPTGRGEGCVWTITPKGKAWCEGRIAFRQRRDVGTGKGTMRQFRVVATWLSALPQGVRV